MLPLEQAMYDKLNRPLLLINSDSFQWPENVEPMHRLTTNNNNNVAERLLLTIRLGKSIKNSTETRFVYHFSITVDKLKNLFYHLILVPGSSAIIFCQI